ncbi:hypothetical protein DFH08DRAFT_704045 [Mycena albidolilacea]|uniref:DUF6534 domain-containing protein n=1 Tax=Mycena albidolilacea TaxID=1033008 RepID=A0AAD6ZVG4_9AGAR|nr:hypothetical protein DFH08DRAFT_704045 [Mycena albidolilacea]
MAPAAPLDTLNKVIGQVPALCLSKFSRLSEGPRALLIGAFVNSMLYMLEILEVIKYFRRFPNDTKTLKCSIVTLVLLDSTCTFAQWTCIYLYGVIHWGDLDYLGYENLAIPIYIYTSGIIGFIVQNFLISRYFKLTKRRIVCAGLIFMTVAALIGSAWCATQLIIVTDYSHRNVAVDSAILWLVSSAATDTAIASTLVIQLRSVTSVFRETRSLIRRLIFHTIQTGSATTAIAICVLVTYLNDNNTNICVGFGFTLGRLYTLTMLFNLNNRQEFKGVDSHSGGINHTPSNEISLHGISTSPIPSRQHSMLGERKMILSSAVHRTAIVHMDEERAASLHKAGDKCTPEYRPFDGVCGLQF